MKKHTACITLLITGLFIAQAHADAPDSTTVAAVAGTTAVVGGAIAIAALSHGSSTPTCNNPTVTITGAEQTVLSYEKSCNFTPNNPTPDIPDVAAHPFIIPSANPANSQVVLIDGVFTGNYRTVGTGTSIAEALTNLSAPGARDCSHSVLTSNSTNLPETYDNNMWLNSPWTNDGLTIYNLVHNEFDAYLAPFFGTSYCPSGNISNCWYPNVIAAVSTDSGNHFALQFGNNGLGQLAIVSPFQYVGQGGEPHLGVTQGMTAHSNIIHNPKGDGYYYVLVQSSTGNTNIPADQLPAHGICLFRNNDISNPAGWHFWDGNSFGDTPPINHQNQMNQSPYANSITNPTICTPVISSKTIGGACLSVTFNTVINQYMAVCDDVDFKQTPTSTPVEAFVYTLSPDLIHWGPPALLKNTVLINSWSGMLGTVGQAYESIVDPSSAGLNFEYSGAAPYLYYTRLNPRTNPSDFQNRDLVRVPLQVTCH